MKNRYLVSVLAMLMVVSLAACGGKTEDEQQTNPSIIYSEDSVDSIGNTENTEEFPDGDPVEYGREYWEEKYPGENICPFYIEVNGREYSYYWISGFEGWNGTMQSWIMQPFNWNGWHMTTDGCIVNQDETVKLTDEWANGEEAMSSCCTVTTEKYDADSAGSEQSGTVKNNVPDALSFKTRADLACRENFIFTAVYSGSEEDKGEDYDGFFFDFFNEDAVYYVVTGFDAEDGTINHIWGYTRMYHFYNDEATYYAALEEVPSYSLKEQNDECLYFTTLPLRNPGAESYSELMEMFENKATDGGEFDNFAPF